MTVMEWNNQYLPVVIQLAGLGQIILVMASVAIPHCLDWNKGLAGLRPLLRQMFWTYAVYVTGVHLFAGFSSSFLTELMFLIPYLINWQSWDWCYSLFT